MILKLAWAKPMHGELELRELTVRRPVSLFSMAWLDNYMRLQADDVVRGAKICRGRAASTVPGQRTVRY